MHLWCRDSAGNTIDMVTASLENLEMSENFTDVRENCMC